MRICGWRHRLVLDAPLTNYPLASQYRLPFSVWMTNNRVIAAASPGRCN